MTAQQPTTYDAIVVGSGITGGWAAKELCERGLRTLVLERGPRVEHGRYPTEWLDPWELAHRGRGERDLYERDYPVQSKNYAFGEATRQFFVSDREHPYLTPEDKPFRWIRGYHLGGRSLTWGRVCLRWSDLDFEANLRDGHGADWPIRFADLEPWYRYVERFVGVSGDAASLGAAAGDYLPPWELNCAEQLVKRGIERAYPGRRMVAAPVANLTRAVNGRGACQARNQCARGCSFGAYFSSLSATLPAAARTGRLTLVTDAVVERVLYDGRMGRAAGVRVIDAATKEEREYRAHVVFLCASTFGTVQLLLNSRDAHFPDGLANESGALGRYLMDHISKAGARGVVPGLDGAYYAGRRPGGTYVPRFRNLHPAEERSAGFLRGYGMQGGAGRAAWGRGATEPGLGADFKARLRDPGPWRMSLQSYGECLPRAENRAELDAEQRDAWGIPLLRIQCAWGDNERALREDAKVQAAEMLEAAGCTEVETYDENAPPGFSVHEMGGARMGRDPKTSVLNAHNQAHAVPNLFVTDGACMASSSCVNPSLTYMALTARACDYAVAEMQRGRL